MFIALTICMQFLLFLYMIFRIIIFLTSEDRLWFSYVLSLDLVDGTYVR